MFLFLVTVLIVPLAFIVIIEEIRKRKKFWKHVLAVPGPKAYPIVGNIKTVFLDSEGLFQDDRNRANTYYPIYSLWSLNLSCFCLLHPDDIELVLTNMKHIEKHPFYDFLHSWLGRGLLTSNGAKWQSRRKILTPAFHFTILQEFIEIFNRETASLIDVLVDQLDEPYINVIKPITEYTLYSIGETSMGTNLKEMTGSKVYKEAIYKLGHLLTLRIMKPWLHFDALYHLSSQFREEKRQVNVLHNFSRGVINDREKLFGTDGKIPYSTKKRMAMLDLLLSAKYAGAEHLDSEGIREEVDTFMFEGHDTTAMAICYILMALANEDKIQEEIRREIYEILGKSGKNPTYNDLTNMKYMERCIKESLRLYPSVPFIGRIAGEEIKTSTGYTIPKGGNMNIYIFDLHRNPRIWEDPQKFDPDRFLPENIANRHNFAYLPFSAGPRNCIGQRFAILEIKAVLCGILRKFNLEPIDTPQTLRFRSDMVLRPLDELRVKFVLRN